MKAMRMKKQTLEVPRETFASNDFQLAFVSWQASSKRSISTLPAANPWVKSGDASSQKIPTPPRPPPIIADSPRYVCTSAGRYEPKRVLENLATERVAGLTVNLEGGSLALQGSKNASLCDQTGNMHNGFSKKAEDNVPESGIPLLTPADAWKTDEQLRQPPIAAPRSIRLVEKTESFDIDNIKDGTDQDSGLCLELSEGRPENEVHESIQNQQSPLAAGSGIVCDEKDGKNIAIVIPRPAPRTVNGGRGSGDCKRESVLSRVQEIEKATRQSPLGGVLRPPGQAYLPENTCCNNGLPTSMALAAAELKRKRASGDSALGEGDSVLPGRVITCTPRSCDLLAVSPDNALAVNPVPKPRRTFQHKTDVRWDNGRSDSALKDRMAIPRKSFGLGNRLQGDAQRKSFEFEDCLGAGRARLKPLNRLMSSPPGQCVSGRLTTPRTVSQENIYEDVTAPTCVSRRGVPVSHRPGGPREHPYEDVGSRCWLGWRRGLSVPLPGNSPSKPWSNFCKSGMPMRFHSRCRSLSGTGSGQRVECQGERPLLLKHAHTEACFSPHKCGTPCLDESLASPAELHFCRHQHIPKTVQKINAIFIAKRGKKRWKKSLSHSPEANLQRDDNSESDSDTEDHIKGHAQRMARLRALRKRSSACPTLERELFEWRERQLFESFIVVGLKRKHSGKAYQAEITYQFPKQLERQSKDARESEERLKAIPHFCFPDAKDWEPVTEYSSETFSFVLTTGDGSRRFGYCRRLLPSGKAPLLPEVYCIISRLGCFALFSKILDEVERRREISAALVYPFMRALVEAPFPAPGRTIEVKVFLPGSGNELIKLRRPSDSRLEHVDFSCLLRCLGVRQLLRLFASLLMERRVIFTADKLSTLSQCGHAAVAMLYPFSWQHTYVPVLPVSMLDIACSPTPFLLGVLSNALPRLRELPLEEVLLVDLCSGRFIRQMDDEDSILPRKLQAALVQVLEQRSELVLAESDSEDDTDGEPGSELNNLASEVFVRFLVEVVGHYSRSLVVVEQGLHEFQREAFRKAVASRGLRRFLELFMQTQMFSGFVQERELGRNDMQGLFELRAAQFLEESPGGEQSGVNRFLRGLGSRMRMLSKK